MGTLHIRVVKRRAGVWFQIGQIFKVDAETKVINRSGGIKIPAYFLVECEENNRTHGKNVHDGMCIGIDCCVVLGGRNKDYKLLLEGEGL